ncbi:MAG: hypothetical protein N2749_03900 [Clostridia bacterium]|nr:hypothetical protein [Clostridia bacterium]
MFNDIDKRNPTTDITIVPFSSSDPITNELTNLLSYLAYYVEYADNYEDLSKDGILNEDKKVED